MDKYTEKAEAILKTISKNINSRGDYLYDQFCTDPKRVQNFSTLEDAIELFMFGDANLFAEFEKKNKIFSSPEEEEKFVEDNILNEMGVAHKFYDAANKEQKRLLIGNGNFSLYSSKKWVDNIPDDLLKYATIAGKGSRSSNNKTSGLRLENEILERVLGSDLKTKNTFLLNPVNMAVFAHGSAGKLTPRYHYSAKYEAINQSILSDAKKEGGIENVLYSSMAFMIAYAENSEKNLDSALRERFSEYCLSREDLKTKTIPRSDFMDIAREGSPIEKIMVIHNLNIPIKWKEIFLFDEDETIVNSALGRGASGFSKIAMEKFIKKDNLHPLQKIISLTSQVIDSEIKQEVFKDLEKSLTSGVFANPSKYETKIDMVIESSLLEETIEEEHKVIDFSL